MTQKILFFIDFICFCMFICYLYQSPYYLSHLYENQMSFWTLLAASTFFCAPRPPIVIPFFTHFVVAVCVVTVITLVPMICTYWMIFDEKKKTIIACKVIYDHYATPTKLRYFTFCDSYPVLAQLQCLRIDTFQSDNILPLDFEFMMSNLWANFMWN